RSPAARMRASMAVRSGFATTARAIAAVSRERASSARAGAWSAHATAPTKKKPKAKIFIEHSSKMNLGKRSRTERPRRRDQMRRIERVSRVVRAIEGGPCHAHDRRVTRIESRRTKETGMGERGARTYGAAAAPTSVLPDT